MRVLFVDDEPRVLDGIMRMMFDAPEGWSLDTAVGGAAAVGLLEGQRFDVVVTDMRMRGMDGAALLALVKDRLPSAVRVVLSGHTDQEAATRALHVAHRFLAKPCSAAALRDVIQRAQRLTDTGADGRLRAVLARIGPLPSPPALYGELAALLRKDDASTQSIAGIVRRDPALSAKVLQIANSAFFCRAGVPVADLRAAISRIGTRLLTSLALTEGVFRACGSVPAEVEAIQACSLRAAHVATALARRLPTRDEAFTGTLLCDVGALVLASQRLDDAPHAALGSYLLDLWGLPAHVVDAVAHHHDVAAIPHAGAEVAAVAYTAHALVRGEAPDDGLVQAYDLDLENGIAALGNA